MIKTVTMLLSIIIDVYLSLYGIIIPNHGYVMIYDIDGHEGLLCHTNHPADSPGGTDGLHSGGAWFRPDGSEVLPGVGSEGFRRNRGAMVVRLYMNYDAPYPLEGIYHCEIEDARDTLQIVYVGLYNDDGGGNVLYV